MGGWGSGWICVCGYLSFSLLFVFLSFLGVSGPFGATNMPNAERHKHAPVIGSLFVFRLGGLHFSSFVVRLTRTIITLSRTPPFSGGETPRMTRAPHIHPVTPCFFYPADTHSNGISS
jgi:hypothetical protein